jgi:hypothetical protein
MPNMMRVQSEQISDATDKVFRQLTQLCDLLQALLREVKRRADAGGSVDASALEHALEAILQRIQPVEAALADLEDVVVQTA